MGAIAPLDFENFLRLWQKYRHLNVSQKFAPMDLNLLKLMVLGQFTLIFPEKNYL